MSTLTAWIRSLGTAGAVVNARVAIDRSDLARHAVDELVGRLPVAGSASPLGEVHQVG